MLRTSTYQPFLLQVNPLSLEVPPVNQKIFTDNSKGLEYLAGRPLENWATITVNSEIITWESSNDLCTFSRSQPIGKSYESASSPTSYAYKEPPPAIIDVIPPTPTSVPESPSCVHCSSNIQKNDSRLGQTITKPPASPLGTKQTAIQPPASPLGANQTTSSSKVETTANTGPKKSDQELSSLLSSPSSTELSAVPITLINEGINPRKEGLYQTINQAADKTSILSQRNVALHSARTTTAATTTTQLHRSQLCSTAVSLSSYSKVKQQATESSFHSQQTSRPSTPHKPFFQHSRKEQVVHRGVLHKQHVSANLLTQATFSKTISSCEKKSSTTSSLHVPTCLPVVNITNTKSNNSITTKAVPLTSKSTTIHSDNLTIQSSYPLKKRPLINVKSGSIVQVDASPLISPKSKVISPNI